MSNLDARVQFNSVSDSFSLAARSGKPLFCHSGYGIVQAHPLRLAPPLLLPARLQAVLAPDRALSAVPAASVGSQLGTRAPSDCCLTATSTFSSLVFCLFGLLRCILRAHIATDLLWKSAGLRPNITSTSFHATTTPQQHSALSSALAQHTHPAPPFLHPCLPAAAATPPLESICRLGPGTPSMTTCP